MCEFVAWGGAPVRKVLNARLAQHAISSRQRVAQIPQLVKISVQGRSDNIGREYRPGHTRRLQRSLFLRAQALDLGLDHLPQTVRYSEIDLIQSNSEMPSTVFA